MPTNFVYVMHKLAMLMALSNVDRVSDFCAFCSSLTPDGEVTVLKSARPDRQIAMPAWRTEFHVL